MSLFKVRNGASKLTKFVGIVYRFLQWIDTLVGKTLEDEELSIGHLRQKMEGVCSEVTEVDSEIEFGSFRIQVFLTHAIGCGLTKQGDTFDSCSFPLEVSHHTTPCGWMWRPNECFIGSVTGGWKIGVMQLQ